MSVCTSGRPRRRSGRAAYLLFAVGTLLAPGAAEGQRFLEEFSYDGLRFTGIGFDVGPVWSDRVTTEVSGAIRVDYGLFAPRVRVVFGGGYFKGALNADEISEFAISLIGLVDDPTNDFSIDVGEITWAHANLDVDLQYLVPSGSAVLMYAGLGLGVHLRNGSGEAIEGTFVEDALDTIAAGLNLSTGAEVALSRNVFVTGDLRGVLTSELRSLSLRGGFKYRLTPLETP